MERPPYNLCGGQNRVQIIITSTRETPLFSLGKNTQKNKEFEHNRCKEVCWYHGTTSMGVSKKKIYRGRTFPTLLRISLSTESFPAPYSMASKYLRRRNAERAESRLVRFAHAIPGSTSGSSASYTPKATKCRNQSKIGSMPERSNMEGTNVMLFLVMDSNVLVNGLKRITSCKNGFKTSSPRFCMTPKLMRIKSLMKVFEDDNGDELLPT